jgi:hypothetical protein
MRESRSGFWHRWDFGLLVCLAGDFGLRGRWTEFYFDGRIQLAGLLLLLLWLAERGIRVSVLPLSWYMDSFFSFKERPRGIPSRLLSCTQLARKTKIEINLRLDLKALMRIAQDSLGIIVCCGRCKTSYIREMAAGHPSHPYIPSTLDQITAAAFDHSSTPP